MKTIEPPDSHFLSSAEGWMGLGDLAEAKAELERMGTSLQNHPSVLEVRWAIFAQEQNWPAAFETARALLQHAPELSSGWLHHAYSLRRVPDGGLQPAWDALFPALDKFPENPLIPYNLACYACQMRRFNVAKVMFQRALGAADDRAEIKRMAMNDPDLEPIWRDIRSL